MISELNYYMNPESGTVQRGDDWIADQKHGGWPISDLKNLIEVYWDCKKESWYI